MTYELRSVKGAPEDEGDSIDGNWPDFGRREAMK
jgi:hypothetical protein